MWLLCHQADKTETKSPLDYIHPVHPVTHLGMIGIAVQVHGHVVMVREIVILIPNVLVHWSVVLTIVVTEVWIVVPMVHTPQVLAQVPAVHMARQVLQDLLEQQVLKGPQEPQEHLVLKGPQGQKEPQEPQEHLVLKGPLVIQSQSCFPVLLAGLMQVVLVATGSMTKTPR